MNVYLTEYEIFAIYHMLSILLDGSTVYDLEDYEKHKVEYDFMQTYDDSLVYKFDVLKRMIEIRHEQNQNQSK